LNAAAASEYEPEERSSGKLAGWRGAPRLSKGGSGGGDGADCVISIAASRRGRLCHRSRSAPMSAS
jgi:hypothetical protein